MNDKKTKTVKGLVKKLRVIRDRMNSELEQMDAKQRSAYFKKMRTETMPPPQSV